MPGEETVNKEAVAHDVCQIIVSIHPNGTLNRAYYSAN